MFSNICFLASTDYYMKYIIDNTQEKEYKPN